MADLKISQLTSVTLPLAGTEVLPIVQSSSTKKVATDDLTVKNVRSNATTGILQVAGPAAAATRTMTVPDANFTAARTDAAQSFTGDQTLGTGNLIQGTALKGVNFTANTFAAGMTSQLLNWHEEGTWTPVYTPSSGAFGTIGAANTGRYRRIGRTVFFWADIRTTGTPNLGTASGQLYIAGLPFTASADGGYGQVSIMQKWNLGTALTNVGVVVEASNTRLYFAKNSSNTSVTYIQATELSTATDNFGNLMGIFGMYTV